VTALNSLLRGESPKKAARPPAWESLEESEAAGLNDLMLPQWMKVEKRRLSLKRPRIDDDYEPETSQIAEISRAPPITVTVSLSVLITTWHDKVKFHAFLIKSCLTT